MARRERLATLAAVALLCAAWTLSVVSAPAALADPAIVDNLNGSKTATWTFDTPSNYTTTGAIQLGPSMLTLSNTTTTVGVHGAGDLLGNGTVDANVTAVAGSLRLLGHGDPLVDGNFSVAGPWTYQPGPLGKVDASWSPAVARFNHSAPPTWGTFEPMDNPDQSTWFAFATAGSQSVWSPDLGDFIEGLGSMRDNVTLVAPGYAGVYNSTGTPWNFSASTRIAVYTKASASGLNVSLGLTTAGGPWVSSPVPLDTTWSAVAFDVSALSGRSSVTRIEFRFSGPAGFYTVHLDSVRLLSDKRFTDTASVAQAFPKTWPSSPSPWSSSLSWEFAVLSASNISAGRGRVSITSGGALLQEQAYDLSLPGTAGYMLDVSGALASSRTYTVTFAFELTVNSSDRTEAELHLDNVALLSPAYHNGSYWSDPMDSGGGSRWTDVNWTATLPAGTDVALSTRSGWTANAGDATWTSWSVHALATGDPIGSAPGRYIQVRVDLTTVNESRTPILGGFSFRFRQFGPQGFVESWPFRPDSLLGWLRFEADAVRPSGTTVAYYIGGGPWRPLSSGDGLTGLGLGDDIQLRVELATTNSSNAPVVRALRVAYEWLGPVTRIVSDPPAAQVTLGSPVTFAVTGMGTFDPGSVSFVLTGRDAYDHAVAFAPSFATNETGGSIVQQGSVWVYTPGSLGAFAVRVTAPGGAFVDLLVFVNAEANPGGAFIPATNPMFWAVLGLSLLAACGGILAWERVFRFRNRMEDLFLIGRDGRLLLHTTLQLHPFRDEDLLAGMLTAVTAFVRDAFRDEDGNGSDLKTFRVGDAKVLVERGSHFYAAAIFRPMEPPWAPKDLAALVQDIELAYGAVLRDWSGDPSDLRGLRALTDDFVRRRRYKNHHRRPPAAKAAS